MISTLTTPRAASAESFWIALFGDWLFLPIPGAVEGASAESQPDGLPVWADAAEEAVGDEHVFWQTGSATAADATAPSILEFALHRQAADAFARFPDDAPFSQPAGSSEPILGPRFGSTGAVAGPEFVPAATAAPSTLLHMDRRLEASASRAGDGNDAGLRSTAWTVAERAAGAEAIPSRNLTLSGGDGGQSLIGGAGADVIYGHSAADLNPGAGAIGSTVIANVGTPPVFLTGAPGDDGFVYVVGKNTGQILRISAATGAQTTFLDVPQGEISIAGEQGLLGLAFHPGYESNGRFFIFLTTASGDIQLREYANAGGNPPVANPAPVQTVITIPHPTFENHNGGWVGFGPDSLLYVSTGDGGGGNDPNNNGQNIDTLLGKVLRLDVNADAFPGDPGRNYAIPGSNPFAGAAAGADEIWAFGLRNPWRMSFDTATGDLYIGDVGQGAREEVDFQPAGSPGGANYGWDLREGTLPGPSWPPSGPVSLTDPVFDYDRNQGASITGGYVYHGPAPGLQDAYVFGDFVSGRLFSLRVVNGEAQDFVVRSPQISGAPLGNIASFGIDNEGNLYVASFDGRIIRLDPGPTAGDGNDTINGGGGADQLYGGAGEDLFLIASPAEHPAAELINGGMGNGDRIRFTSSTNGQTLTLSGQATQIEAIEIAATNGIFTGTTTLHLDASVLGYGVELRGNNGVNHLRGTAFADTMNGRGGDDFHFVDNSGDVVVAAPAEGFDRVLASVSHALAATAHIEELTATNPALTTALNLTGNNFSQTLVGNAGNNRLDGKAGADIMNGLGGDDFYFVDNPGDTIVAAAGAGDDRVFTSIRFTLLARHEIEALTATNPADTTMLVLTGNAIGQTIVGNAGHNALAGKGGADVLNGLGGNDFFHFDTALWPGNVDRIVGYATADDTIRLDDAVFAQITDDGTGFLASSHFAANATGQASDATDRILYETDTGSLFYDADGTGAAARIQFASMQAGLAMTSNEFFVV